MSPDEHTGAATVTPPPVSIATSPDVNLTEARGRGGGAADALMLPPPPPPSGPCGIYC